PPLRLDIGARQARFEFTIAKPIGLLAIGGPEVLPSGPQVAADVLHQRANAVGFRVEVGEELLIAHLCRRALGEHAETGKLFTDGIDERGKRLPHEREYSRLSRGGAAPGSPAEPR